MVTKLLLKMTGPENVVVANVLVPATKKFPAMLEVAVVFVAMIQPVMKRE